MQHLHAVEGAQARGDLLDEAADSFEVGARIVGHPLFQGLAFDELGRDVEVAAPPRL